jgi:predicted Rossmann fold nucleotide-binding protein DprA/Smf involved in DNA uptake
MGDAKRNWREDLKVLRERLGGVSEEKKARTKDTRETVKAIEGALKSGPRTVPEISAETKIPTPKVLWFLMAMKKYGRVAEAGHAGDYLRYGLKEASA